ncbi:MAG: MFS transporter [Betaproteobacteria bacterium]|nr:MFS transporter [Betaproteobacteria bacterium]
MPFYLLIFFSGLLHSVFAATRVSVSLYAIHLKATPFEIGTVMALFGLLPMVLAVAVGRLNDRIGPRVPMLAGSALVSLGVVVPALFPSLVSLYVAATLSGTGFMIYAISVHNVVGFVGKAEDRSANFSLFALSFSVSSFVGPLATGLAIDTIGHRYWFVVLAALPAVTIASVMTDWIRLPQLRPRSQRAAQGRVMDLLRNRALRTVLFISALHAIAWEMFQFMTPIYGTQIGLSASAIGVVMASFSAATFLVRLTMAFITRHAATLRLLRFTILLAAAVFALFPFAGEFALLAALAFVLGVGLGSSQPMVMAVLYDTVPPERTGEAVGLRTTIITTGQGIMPIAFGALGSAFGLAPVFWAVAVVLAAGCELAFRR